MDIMTKNQKYSAEFRMQLSRHVSKKHFHEILNERLLYNFFKKMAETSNANLIKNADYLLESGKQDNSVWVSTSKQRYDSRKFKLT